MSISFSTLSTPCYAKKTKNAKWKTHWTRPIPMTDPELFQSKKRKDRLVSVTRTIPVNFNRFPDTESVFKYLIPKKKTFLESTPTISNWSIKKHSWDKEKNLQSPQFPTFLAGMLMSQAGIVLSKKSSQFIIKEITDTLATTYAKAHIRNSDFEYISP
ncbi:MAG: hypothetical protein OXM55_01225 [Bdellovibrionales bacterium]|nr:hypothetical protein [Bdellovibrionales bacterium]